MSRSGYQAYVICTSPRSGSTLLCRLLAATGVAGSPESYFHEPSLVSWLEDFGLDPRDFATEIEMLKEVISKAKFQGESGTDLFGLRLQRRSFDFFESKLALLHPNLSDTSSRIEATFGRTLFIHLTRADKLAQAVSFIKASQTGLWHMAPDGTEIERLSEHHEPEYDAALIRDQIAEFTTHEAEWKLWFYKEQIQPLTLKYDDLAIDPCAALRTVFDELGLDPAPVEGLVPPVAKLADRTNAQWIERYRAEIG